MKTYLMFVDESGTSSPTFKKQYPYILTGVVIEESKQERMKELFDDLKMKYWNKKSIVLHSEDIGKNLNDCSIFRDNKELKQNFVSDLMGVIEKAPVMCFQALVDKEGIPRNWLETTIIRKTARSIFFSFLMYLMTRHSRSRGKIIIEASSAYKDSEYLNAFNFFLSPGCGMVDSSVSYEEIRKRLTQISFVTKLNHDTETQIADILSYGATCKYKQLKGEEFSPGSYEQIICNVLDKKQFSPPSNIGPFKQKMYDKVESFKIFAN